MIGHSEGIAEIAGLDNAELENDRLENDGRKSTDRNEGQDTDIVRHIYSNTVSVTGAVLGWGQGGQGPQFCC